MKPDPPTFQAGRFLHPRYWLTWLGLGILWLLVQLPYPLLLKCGNALGLLLYRLVRRRRHIAETNIRLAFPALNAGQQTALVKDHFRANGIAMLEIGLSWWGNEKRLRQLAHIQGLEHLQQALSQGCGAIMLGGHFTSLIIAGRILALEIPFNIVVKKSHNKMFEALMHHYRCRQYQGLINGTDMRSMLRSLKNNQILWYAPDQDFGSRAAVFAPFMGIATACLNSTARMAKISRAPVIYIDFARRPGNQGYQLKLHPPLDNFPSGDDVEDARRINALIEQQVHAVPEQYLWVHRRFKTRPPGEPGLYDWADTQRTREAQQHRPNDETPP